MIAIRPAVAGDQQALGRMGGALMRQHHAADPKRFLMVDDPETGYGRFLVSQLDEPEALVLVAESSGTVVGYVFAGLEPVSWMELRGPCGFVHDVWVDDTVRGGGVGRRLVSAAIEWIQAQGRAQVGLWTKTGNEHAQALFRSLGFRATMLEMTLDR